MKEGKRVWIVGTSNQHIRYLRGLWEGISGDSGLYPDRYFTLFQYETPKSIHSRPVEVYMDHYVLELQISELERKLEVLKKEATRWDE